MAGSAYNRLSVEDKMAKVMVNLRRLRPYYSAVYEVLERIESENVPTMGVNIKQMIYNPKFVDKLSFEELMFVSLHEISHVALMHVTRGKGKEPRLWNIAADLYINAMLKEEFGTSDLVHMPKDVLYCSSIDLDNESVDDIYNSLHKQIQDAERETYEQFKKDNKGKGQPTTGNGSSENKGSGQPNNKKDPSECDGGSGSLEGDSQSEKVSSGTINGKPFLSKKVKISYTGTNPTNKATDKFEMDVNGVYVYDCDIDSNSESTGNSELDEQEARRILSDADVKARMMGSVGHGTCRVEQFIKNILKSHVDWRSLLRKYCIQLRSTETSFARPDKRMYYQRAIYPGNEIEESNYLKDIKVAIDTSGSVTDEYLMYIYGQIKDILDQYKVNGELILWDGDINAKCEFHEFKDIAKKAIQGRGGTNPECVFEYYDSNKCKIKPALTLIFSDGYYWNFESHPKMGKWKKKYKDTIWIMTKEHNREFKPPFGKLAHAKF